MLKIPNQLRNFRNKLRDLRSDDDGASLIEYSVLIGLITVAVIALIIGIGDWVVSQWSALTSAVGA